jgi:hypothetical protein
LTLSKGELVLQAARSTEPNPSPVYTNCLLVSLNARQHFRDRLQDVQLDPIVYAHASNPSSSGGQTFVRVSRHTEAHHDASLDFKSLPV